MATYKAQYFDNSNITTAALNAFLTAAGWQYTVDGDVTTIELSNKVSFRITKGLAGYNNFTFAVIINGTVTSMRTISRYMTLVACKAQNIAFLEAYGGYDGNRAAILWEKIGDQEFYGYVTDNQSSFIPINSINLSDVDNSTVYTHAALLNYAAEAGKIDFVDNDCLFLSGVKSINDPNFKACSTMTANTVITVQGKNCFVIGSHSLVEIDD
ncbi:MAG: hypothetical protein IKP06_07675 [Elusimicrobiaceae bacterium]|nr:hypothetical protein [Elusimicrobiaceae bacterium]